MAMGLGAFAAPSPQQQQQPPRWSDVKLLTDIDQIQQYWGQVKPYNDTPASFFGVPNTGLPYGCGYE